MQIILERTEAYKQKVRANVHSKDNKEGVLTHAEQVYTDCLPQVRYAKLEDLYRQDETNWTEKLTKVKAHASQL